MKVYLVILDWKYDDDADFDYHIFGSYEKAVKKFKEIIFDEMTDSWVSEMLDDDEKIDTENCEFYTNMSEIDGTEKNLYWSVTDKYGFREDNLRLDIVEVE